MTKFVYYYIIDPPLRRLTEEAKRLNFLPSPTAASSKQFSLLRLNRRRISHNSRVNDLFNVHFIYPRKSKLDFSDHFLVCRPNGKETTRENQLLDGAP